MPRWSPFEPYFWSLVAKSDEKDCWEWLGNFDGKGYGRIWKDGRRQRAHRVSYELSIAKIPDDLYACHHCDNKRCVNPHHIFIGTHTDNMRDLTNKGLNKLINGTAKVGDFVHWTKDPAARQRISDQRKSEFKNGVRQIVHGEDGRLLGTRTVSI